MHRDRLIFAVTSCRVYREAIVGEMNCIGCQHFDIVLVGLVRQAEVATNLGRAATIQLLLQSRGSGVLCCPVGPLRAAKASLTAHSFGCSLRSPWCSTCCVKMHVLLILACTLACILSDAVSLTGTTRLLFVPHRCLCF